MVWIWIWTFRPTPVPPSLHSAALPTWTCRFDAVDCPTYCQRDQRPYQQVEAAIALLDEGATVPFIARYRKEVTGGLDDTQLRNLHERLGYLRELEERREAVLASIGEQGKLSPELAALINEAETKARLEDLYLPYKPSAAPRRRSPARPVWSRWPMRFWAILHWIRRRPPRAISTPKRV